MMSGTKDYEEMISSVEDIVRRIGPAASPEWIRGKLQSVLDRHKRRIDSIAQSDKQLRGTIDWDMDDQA